MGFRYEMFSFAPFYLFILFVQRESRYNRVGPQLLNGALLHRDLAFRFWITAAKYENIFFFLFFLRLVKYFFSPYFLLPSPPLPSQPPPLPYPTLTVHHLNSNLLIDIDALCVLFFDVNNKSILD